MTEDYLVKLKDYRNILYRHRQNYIELNSRTRFGHPVTKQSIEVYNSVIRSLEELFLELIDQLDAQKIK